jgi:hypothetical protein
MFSDLHIQEAELDGEGFFVDLGAHGVEILVKGDAPLARKRFTLAHELGHYMLRDYVSREPTERILRSVRPKIEQWCNNFAADLLMPEKLMKEHLRSRGLRGLNTTINQGPEKFLVSRAAFSTRATEVAPLSLFFFSIKGNMIVNRDYYLSSKDHTLRWTERLNDLLRELIKTTMFEPFVEDYESFRVVGSQKANDSRELLLSLIPPRAS